MTRTEILKQGWTNSLRPQAVTLPPLVTRLVGIALALAVSTVHVADQGGITDLAAPNWLVRATWATGRTGSAPCRWSSRLG
jgi:hypothetical protein